MSSPDNFLPDYMRDALQGLINGDSAAVADVAPRLTAELLGQLVTPDADTPAAVLDAMARTMARSGAQSDEAAAWEARQGDLLAALTETPRVVVEYIDFLHRSMVGMQTTVADGLLAMAAGFDELDSNPDALLASLGLAASPAAQPEPEPTWQAGDTFRLGHVGAAEQVVIAVHGDIVFHANVNVPGAYVSNHRSALAREGHRTGRLGVMAMGDVRRRFVDTMGCTIEERLGLTES